jgi:SAM-dependent methyltransferase
MMKSNGLSELEVSSVASGLNDDTRLRREKEFYNELVVEGSRARRLLDRFSDGFYEKGRRGRLWGAFWDKVDLNGAAVLDYGCGRGEFSRTLADLGADVYGIDISPQLIAKARKFAPQGNNCCGSVQFFVGDAHRTPFPDNFFDYVLGNGALHHLDLDRAFTEIARVTKPGGKARFMEPMYHHPLLWSLRRLTPKIHTADEKPLSWADMERPNRWFRVCSHEEHFLFAVCAAPAHLLGRSFALSVIGALDRWDQVAMSVQPWLRRFAWYTVLELEK